MSVASLKEYLEKSTFLTVSIKNGEQLVWLCLIRLTAQFKLNDKHFFLLKPYNVLLR